MASMAGLRTFRGVVAELQAALGAEASDTEILELAHLLVNQPERPGPKTVMHGGSPPMNEMPICDVLERHQWKVVSEEWLGEDTYAANQPIEDLVDWQLMIA